MKMTTPEPDIRKMVCESLIDSLRCKDIYYFDFIRNLVDGSHTSHLLWVAADDAVQVCL